MLICRASVYQHSLAPEKLRFFPGVTVETVVNE